MVDPGARTYFVLTLRGDRGPLDRDGVKGLLQAGEARQEDQVRNAWGKQIGTVGEILRGTSDRRQRVHTSDRVRSVGKTTSTSPATRYLVVGIIVLLAIVLGWAVESRMATTTTTTQTVPAETTQQRAEVPVAQPPVIRPITKTPPDPVPSASVAAPIIANETPVVHVVQSGHRSSDSTIINPLTADWTSYALAGIVAGSDQQLGDQLWTIRGGGRMDADQEWMSYIAKTLPGDGAVTARISSLEPTATWTSVGIMMRSGPEPEAAKVHMLANPQGRVLVNHRVETGISSIGEEWWAPRPFPIWLRIVRRGANFRCLISTDGQRWNSCGQPLKVPALRGRLLAGVAVCSQANQVITTATISDVQVGSISRDDAPVSIR